MKRILAALAVTVSLYAQEPKDAAPAPEVKERKALKPEQWEKFLRLQMQEQLERERSARALDAALVGIRLEHNALVKEVCAAVHVDEAKIDTECAIDPKAAGENKYGEVRREKRPEPAKQEPAK